jgi:hypothetical protein
MDTGSDSYNLFSWTLIVAAWLVDGKSILAISGYTLRLVKKPLRNERFFISKLKEVYRQFFA